MNVKITDTIDNDTQHVCDPEKGHLPLFINIYNLFHYFGFCNIASTMKLSKVMSCILSTRKSTYLG